MFPANSEAISPTTNALDNENIPSTIPFEVPVENPELKDSPAAFSANPTVSEPANPENFFGPFNCVVSSCNCSLPDRGAFLDHIRRKHLNDLYDAADFHLLPWVHFCNTCFMPYRSQHKNCRGSGLRGINYDDLRGSQPGVQVHSSKEIQNTFFYNRYNF